jgi:hypothetical protein
VPLVVLALPPEDLIWRLNRSLTPVEEAQAHEANIEVSGSSVKFSSISHPNLVVVVPMPGPLPSPAPHWSPVRPSTFPSRPLAALPAQQVPDS